MKNKKKIVAEKEKQRQTKETKIKEQKKQRKQVNQKKEWKIQIVSLSFLNRFVKNNEQLRLKIKSQEEKRSLNLINRIWNNF